MRDLPPARILWNCGVLQVSDTAEEKVSKNCYIYHCYRVFQSFYDDFCLSLCIDLQPLQSLGYLALISVCLINKRCRIILYSFGFAILTRRLTLQKLHSRTVIIVTNSSYDAPADALIQKLKWASIAEIIKRKTATMIYKF